MLDIARGVAFASLLFVMSLYIPIAGFFLALFIPAPILYYRAKLGRTNGRMISILTVTIMVLTLGGIRFDFFFFGALVVLGSALGDLFEQNLSIEKTVLYADAAVIIIGIFSLFVYGTIGHTGIKSMVIAYVAGNIELTLLLYEKMGVTEESVRMISNSMDQIQYILVRIIPALVVAGILIITWMNLLIARPIFRMRNLVYPDFGELKLWKAPEILVWFAIGCGVLVLFPDRSIKVIVLNVILILLIIYFFQGIAIVSFFFEKKKFPRGLRVFLYSLIAIQQVVLLVVIGLGFFDMWLNFRKLGVSKT